MPRPDIQPQRRRRRWFTVHRPVACLVLSLAVATRAFGVQASDDHVLVYILDSSLTVAHHDLLINDQDAGSGSVFEPTGPGHGPRHGTASWGDHTVTYVPDETFWAVGSDSLTYRVETPQGSSTATLYLVAHRPERIFTTMLDFESATDPFAYQHPGLSILQGSGAILGNGSLQVDVSPEDPSVFGTVELPDAGGGPDSNNNGDLEICLVGGSGGPSPITELPGDQGYVVLLGQETDTTPEQAVLRVGIAEGGDYFLEIKEVNVGGTFWHRSADLPRHHDISRFRVTFQHGNNLLAAILRTEGLVVRMGAVPFHADSPTHFHLGYFQPAGGGGGASLLVDQVRVGSNGLASQSVEALLDPLLMADGFEDKTTNAWTASYGSGLIFDLASSSTGEVGLGVTGLSGGPSFVSFQPQVADELLDELSAELRVDASSFAIDPTHQLTLAAIRSTSDPLFGDPDYQLRVKMDAGSLAVRAFFRLDPETWLPETYGGWEPMAGNTVLRLQVGKADGDTFNGWMRVWAGGQIIQELFHLDNDDRPLRTVHFGAKSFLSQYVSGTLRFDDLNVTR